MVYLLVLRLAEVLIVTPVLPTLQVSSTISILHIKLTIILQIDCFLTMPTRRRGMAQLGVNAGVVAANPTFYNDYLRDVSKRTALSASDDSMLP